MHPPRRERLPRRCAWCGRYESGGVYVAVETLAGVWAEQLADRATHGICPECFEEQQRAAETARGRARRDR